MPGALDKLETWRFGPVYLLVQTASVRLTMRRHEHVYPHTAGAQGEKLGRGLYQIQVKGKFDDGAYMAPEYNKSLRQMGTFRSMVEKEMTHDLIIPWIGRVQAQCTEFELTEKNTIRSGLEFSATFVEDMDHGFPIAEFVKVKKAPLLHAVENLKSAKFKEDIFSKIANAVSFVLGIKDQVQLYTALVQSKLDYLEGLLKLADATSKELLDPGNITGIDAFFELWEALRTFENDITEKGLEFSYYSVPMLMSIQDVAVKIYGTAENCGDLLGLNVLADAMVIPAGTKIRYYK